MANVTYLLGAGASYNALPVVDELDTQIGILVGVLELIRDGRSIQNSKLIYENFRILSELENRSLLENAIDNLKILRTGCRSHLSIDTYLKMLFLTKNSQYEKMKSTIVLFFCLQQCLHVYMKDFNKAEAKQDIVDKRYDAFFASILQNSFDKFPNNIKILSWNYDNQFEKAYYKYLQHASSKSTIDELLNIYHKNEKEKDFKSIKFAIYKLNGSASYFNSENNKLISQINTKNESVHVSLKRILNEYNNCNSSDSIKPAISFAWDEPEETRRMLEDIKFSIVNTDILVLIGYSMPFFNRNIDKEILSKTTIPKNIKIYVQDKEPSGIIERLYGIRPPQSTTTTPNGIHRSGELIQPITDLRQFYLPDEL